MPKSSSPEDRDPLGSKTAPASAGRMEEKAENLQPENDWTRVRRELQEKVAQLEKVAAELRRSEARYRELVQNANSAIIGWKRDGTLVFFNEYAQSFFGYSEADILGKHVGILVPELDSAGRDLKALVRGIVRHPERYVQNVNENVCRDGRRVWMAWTNRPVLDEDGKVREILAVGTDMTERRRVEEALRESEAKFRSAFAKAAIGFAMTDPEGRYLDANEAYCRLTGYGVEELRAMRFQQMIHPEDFGKNMALVDRMLAGEIPDFTLENRYLRKDGKAIWTRKSVSLVRDASGAPQWIIALIQDISGQKRAEESLLQSREHFARAQEVGQIGWWRLDVRRNVLTWSDENHRIFGVPIGTPMTYEGFLAACHPEDREYVDMQWKAGLRGDRYDIEHRVVASGRVKWVREKAYLEFDGAGGLLGGFGITQDITERKEAEQEAQRLTETLEQRVAERTAEVGHKADQLRALASELSRTELRERKRLAGVLHDHIQQLMVAARMQANFIRRDGDVEKTRAAAESIDGILREALDASRSLALDLSPPALQEGGLAAGLDWLASRFRENNRFAVHVRADDRAEPSVEEMRFLLFECARELLFNAVKHAGVAEAQLTLLRSGDGQIRMIVSDEGRGFDPDALRNRHPSDMTFGLFGVQERLMHIGGRMEVESAPGKGTRVTLVVPAGEEPAGAGAPAPEEESAPALETADIVFKKRAPCRVLIVDDHKIMRDGLRGLIQFEAGIDVAGEAADGSEAIELARRLKPDVIIMDINLGDMTGIEATRKILADRPDAKIIGLSMHRDAQIAAAMRDAGAVAYLTKGGPAEDLIAAIHACAPAG